MDSVNELATMLKSCENCDYIGINLGVITSINEGSQKVNIFLASEQINISTFHSNIHYFFSEDVGKEVIVDCSEDNQTFYVLGFNKTF